MQILRYSDCKVEVITAKVKQHSLLNYLYRARREGHGNHTALPNSHHFFTLRHNEQVGETVKED